MPRPNLPPTPGSSSDIRGKEGSHAAPTFSLPPTAYHEPTRASTNSSGASPSSDSDSSYRPNSPTSPAVTSRVKPALNSTSMITKDDFLLPPPPTRSRKIIQMKPKQSEQQETQVSSAVTSRRKTQDTAPAAGKRKQNNAGTTAAGRKIARKTAHSLIERRRRSKMNEEFGVLKDMIPACQGQEMHKLAILQASIEYLRYLEQCVSDLQAQNGSPQPPPPPSSAGRLERGIDDDQDEEMEDDGEADEITSAPATTAHRHSQSVLSLPSLSEITTTTTTSPSIFPLGYNRHYSTSSATSSYSPYFHSNQASPAFGPQLHHVPMAPTFATTFGLGSPALKPADSSPHLRHMAEGAVELSEKRKTAANGGRSEQELDHEATAALLMLNHDRRNWRPAHGPETGRSSTSMSVKDLLSS